jgi:hypothetical protein
MRGVNYRLAQICNRKLKVTIFGRKFAVILYQIPFMRTIKYLLSVTAVLFIHLPAMGFEFDPNKFEMINKVYYDGIRTVRMYPSKNPLELPIVRLEGGTLELHFDDMYEGASDYHYTIIHCNADWTPSNLTKSDYIDGYQEYFLSDFDYSFNTFVPYTHFRLRLPNKNMQFTISGNYLIVVYEKGAQYPVLTRRFMVYESFTTIEGFIRRPTELDRMNTHQQVHFRISHPGYIIPDPQRDLSVTVLQNQDWTKVITNIDPQFIHNDQLIFERDKGNSFPGGNEFRFFDTKNLMVLTQNIRKIDIDSIFNVFLAIDPLRYKGPYVYWDDINGMYVVRRQDAPNSDVSADYALVDFFLESPRKLPGDVYVFGELSDWKLKDEFKLTYNSERFAYQGKILIKQGYYNYHYVTAIPSPDGGKYHASLDFTEGNHWETENAYHVLVYHREIGIRYDRLIGYKRFQSQPSNR